MARKFEAYGVITAVDKFSGPLRGIQSRTQSAAGRIGLSVGRIGNAATRATAQLRQMAGPLAALSVAGAVGGVARLVNSFGAAGDELAKMSFQVGVSVEALQELRYVADRSGVSAGGLDRSLQVLTKRLGEARTAQGPLYSGLRKSNMALFQQLTAAESTEDAMTLLLDAMRDAGSEADRAAIANAAFGRSGLEMARIAANTAGDIEALREEKRRLGVMTAQDAANSAAFVDAKTAMGEALTGLQIRIGSQLLPAMTAAVQGVTTWIESSREAREVVAGVTGAVRGLMTRLESVDVGAIVGGMRGLIDTGRSLIETFGLGNLALGALAVVFAPTLAGVVSLASAFVSLGISTVGAVPALYAMAAGMTAASWPVLAVVAGVTALAGGAYLLYRNWEPVTAWFASVWERVSGWFGAAWTGIRGSVAAMAAAARGTLWESWEPIRGLFAGLWSGITGAFGGAWTTISGIIGRIAGAVSRVRGVLSGLGLVPAGEPDGQPARPGGGLAARRTGAPGTGLEQAAPAASAAPPGARLLLPPPQSAGAAPAEAPVRKRESMIKVMIETSLPGVSVSATPDRDDDLEVGLSRLGAAH